MTKESPCDVDVSVESISNKLDQNVNSVGIDQTKFSVSSEAIIEEDPKTKSHEGWKRYLGLIYTLISTNCFSLASVVLKKYSSAHPFNLGTWAFPLSALIPVPFIIYDVKIKKQSVLHTFWPINKHKKVVFFMFFRTVLSSSIPYFLVLSVKHISVADMRTIISATVITVFLISWLFLGEKCGVVPIVVAFLALCGIIVMTRPPILTGAEDFDESTIVGVSFALLALVLVTFVIVTIRYLQNVHHGVLNVVLYVWAFVQSLILALAFDKFEIPNTWEDGLGMTSAGILMALGNTFLVLALQTDEAGVVALIRTSEVIFTFSWQFVFIGIKPDHISVIGAILVLSGVIVITLRKWVDGLPTQNKYRIKLSFLLR